MQNDRDELKTSKKQIEQLRRVRETHMKQLTFLTETRQELERQNETLQIDYNILRNGANALCAMH